MLQGFTWSDRSNDRKKCKTEWTPVLFPWQYKQTFAVTMTLSTSGQWPREHEGSLEPGGAQKGILGLSTSPSFFHSVMCSHSGLRLREPRSGWHQPTESRAGVKSAQPHTGLTQNLGCFTQSEKRHEHSLWKLKVYIARHMPVVTAPRRHGYQHQILSCLTPYSSALLQTKDDVYEAHKVTARKAPDE